MESVDVKQVADRAARSAGQPVDVGKAVLNALVNLIHFELMKGNRVVMPDLIALSYSDTGALRTESLITDENGELTPIEPIGGAAPAPTTPGGTIVIPGVGAPAAAPVAAEESSMQQPIFR